MRDKTREESARWVEKDMTVFTRVRTLLSIQDLIFAIAVSATE